MSLHSRLRHLADALPSDSSAVTFTRADLRTMLDEDDVHESDLILRDLRIEEVAEETCRSPSTVRSWLISGQLRGYKLQGRDWRVPRSALRAFLDACQRRLKMSQKRRLKMSHPPGESVVSQRARRPPWFCDAAWVARRPSRRVS